MSQLDPRSLIFVSGLLGLMCSAILFMLRQSFPASITGLRTWGWGLLSMVVASGLYGLTGTVPEMFSSVLSNGLLVGGIMLVYIGFLRFLKQSPRMRLLAVILVVLLCHVTWFTYVKSSYPARALLVTFIDTILFFSCALLVFRHSANTLAGRFTFLVFVGIGIVSAVRVLTLILHVDAPATLLGPTTSQKVYLAALAFSVLAITMGAIMMANERLRTELEFIASHDQLTGAFSRGAFITLLQTELARSGRSGKTPALLMFDLDNFKSINDRFGHVVGDRVIADFVQRTRELLRAHDALGRYGGEEFIALMPETSPGEAKNAAERICRHIAIASDPDLPAYTVSIGVAGASGAGMSLDSLLSRTDQALYLAKAEGRNCVRLADANHTVETVSRRSNAY